MKTSSRKKSFELYQAKDITNELISFVFFITFSLLVYEFIKVAVC